MNIRLIIYSFLTLSGANAIAQADTTQVKDSLAKDIPVFILDTDGGSGESNQTQGISGLLQASKDVYISQVGFNFSFARFRTRGYNSNNTSVFLNGMPGNDPESGRTIWAYWGGLNDVTRYPEIKYGISSSKTAFGSIGGYSNVSMRASDKRAGSKFSYAATNRTYTSRVMFTHNTGMNEKGWAFATTISGRYSKEGYVEGTYYRGMSYFVAAEKKLNKNHSVNLAVFGAPTVQARGSISVQEAYDLTGNNFYNAYWGFQNGEKRNARIRNNHKPYVLLTDYLKLNEKSKLTTTVYYESGKTSNSNLNWYNANDPRPDYYRNLPSNHYNRQEVPQGDALTTDWTTNNTDVTQINWDNMYQANYKNLATVHNANGSGASVTGNRSKYILQDYRLDPKRLGLNTVYNNNLSDKLFLTASLNGYTYKSENYLQMNDLLGGEFWVDVDQFAERDLSGEDVAQNDLSTPNKIVKKGDRFGYDYEMHINYMQLLGNLDIKITKKLSSYVGLSLNNTTFWRDGQIENGKFREESIGESEKLKFNNYGVKAGLLYKVTGRHLLSINYMNQTKAPSVRDAFISPRSRNATIDGLTSAKINSADINYMIRYPKLQMRLTGFYTEIKDQTWSRSFYHDQFRNFVNYMMTDVDQLFMGVEFGIKGNITSTLELSGAFTTGQYIYTNRPNASISVNNSAELLAENKTIYLKNYKIGGGPQTAGTIGLMYRSPKYWFAGINGNYVTDIYLSPSPDRRTEEAVAGFVDTDPQVAQILDQTKLDDGYSINMFVGKSWRIKDGKFIRFNVNINNLTNNKNFNSGGFEQLRYDAGTIDKFPPKLGYAYGLNYFAMLSYQF